MKQITVPLDPTTWVRLQALAARHRQDPRREATELLAWAAHRSYQAVDQEERRRVARAEEARLKQKKEEEE